MSQNTIISVVLIILAIIFGVYFINSEPVTPQVNYSGDTKEKAKEKEKIVSNEETVEVVDEPDTSTADDSADVADVTADTTDETPDTSIETEKVVEDDSTMTAETETTDTEDIVIVDDTEEAEKKVLTYNIAISGSQSSLSKAFSIVATNTEGRKEEFTQAKLEDSVYKISSEEKFTTFSINAEGYAPVLKDVPLIVEPATSVTVEIKLELLAGFTGMVKSFNGKVVGGAVVKISKGSFRKTAYVDIKGKFKFTDLNSGEYKLKVIHPQFDLKTLTATIEKGEIKEVVVSLDRNAILLGNLLDGDGKSVVGVKITLSLAGNKSGSVVTSGANGEFKINDIAKGKYVLKVSSVKGQLSEKISFQKNLIVSKNFKLTAPPSISGVVVNVEGKPIAGIKLFTFDDKRIIECESKKNGRFVLPLAKKGKYRILTNGKKYEINNNINLYTPGTKKIILQVLKKKYLKGKVQTSSGISIDKNYILKIKNKKTGLEKRLIVYEIINGEFNIPMSLFSYVSKSDYVQIIAESKDFGRGESLSFKFSDVNLGKSVLITLGD